MDVVLNSLTGEGFIETSLSCLRHGGRFVELARRDILSEEEMAAVRPDVAYDILELDVLKKTEPAWVGKVLREVVDGLAAGDLKPIVHSRWPLAEAGAALSFMRSARHLGKIVVTPPPLMQGRLRSDRTYLVTGGLGGIGCAVAGWLADHGAGAIALNGRRAPDTEAEEAISRLRGARRDGTGGTCGCDGHRGHRSDAGADRCDATAARGRDPQRGCAVGWRADQPELGAIRNGALAENTGRMASAPSDSGPRSGYVRPLFEPSWRHGQSGSGEPRRGQCVSGSARRSPPRTGASLDRPLLGERGQRSAKPRNNGSGLTDNDRHSGAAGLPRSRVSGHSTNWCARMSRLLW